MSERERALKEAIKRVQMMSTDDGETWDLSENDQIALKAVLAALPVIGDAPRCEWRELPLTSHVYQPGCEGENADAARTAMDAEGWKFCPNCGKSLVLRPAEESQ